MLWFESEPAKGDVFPILVEWYVIEEAYLVVDGRWKSFIARKFNQRPNVFSVASVRRE
jgi:hypothetical protein